MQLAAPMNRPEEAVHRKVTSREEARLCEVVCRRVGEIAGLESKAQWEVCIAVSELLTNAIKFAGRADLWVEAVAEPKPGLKIVVVDKGPGIIDLVLFTE